MPEDQATTSGSLQVALTIPTSVGIVSGGGGDRARLLCFLTTKGNLLYNNLIQEGKSLIFNSKNFMVELSPKQQFIELIKSSQKILLLTHKDPDGDAIGSILALYFILKKMGKDVTATFSGLYSPNLAFLPVENLADDLSLSKDFIIHLDTSRVGIEKISYLDQPDKNSQKMSLIITPEKGRFSKDDVSFEEGQVKHDLVIALDCADITRAGKVYAENKEIFAETPIVNIDHHQTNSNFGKVNLVDKNATSTAEILVSMIESLGREKNLLDPVIATCLLTGLIFDTDSFQNDNTTPKSFTVAAQLVAAGAKQQQIIKNIYKNKSLTTLRVWGVVLSNLVEEKESGFVWAKIDQAELAACGADSTATEGINNELLRTVPEALFSLLITENEEGIVEGSLRSIDPDFNVIDIATIFSGGGHPKAAGFSADGGDVKIVTKEVIEKIKKYLASLPKKTDNTGKGSSFEI